MKALLTLAVFTKAVALALAANHMTHVTLPESTSPGGRCMDGSMAGYFVRTGTDPNLFVIFFAGGGACTTSENCLVRSRNRKGRSSNGRWADYMEHGTLLDQRCSENPDFCRATAVFIPYCTGDTHRGTAEKSDEPGWNNQYYFDGHSNFRAIVEKLVDENNFKDSINTKVLLTGTSAGAVGAFYNGEWLKKRLPTALIAAAPVAGWFYAGSLPGDLPAIYAPSDYTHFAAGTHGNPDYDNLQQTEEFPDIWKMRDVLPAGCLDRFVNETHDLWLACASIHNAYRHIEMPIFNVHTQYDSYIILQTGGAPEHVVDPAEMDTARGYVEMIGEAYRHSFQQILNDKVETNKTHADGVFSASCFNHGGQASVKINGMGWREIVGDWFFQHGALTDRHRQVEECGDTDGFTLPCNPANECKLSIPSPMVTPCTQAIKDAGCLNKKNCKVCAKMNRRNTLKGACKIKEASANRLEADICRFNNDAMTTSQQKIMDISSTLVPASSQVIGDIPSPTVSASNQAMRDIPYPIVSTCTQIMLDVGCLDKKDFGECQLCVSRNKMQIFNGGCKPIYGMSKKLGDSICRSKHEATGVSSQAIEDIPFPNVTACTLAIGDAGCLEKKDDRQCQLCAWQNRITISNGGCKVENGLAKMLVGDICQFDNVAAAASVQKIEDISSPMVTICTQAMGDAGCLDTIDYKQCQICVSRNRIKIKGSGCWLHGVANKVGTAICRSNSEAAATSMQKMEDNPSSLVVTACTLAMEDAGCLNKKDSKQCQMCASQNRIKIRMGECKVKLSMAKRVTVDICQLNNDKYWG